VFWQRHMSALELVTAVSCRFGCSVLHCCTEPHSNIHAHIPRALWPLLQLWLQSGSC
jgi:hypothetical protein